MLVGLVIRVSASQTEDLGLIPWSSLTKKLEMLSFTASLLDV